VTPAAVLGNRIGIRPVDLTLTVLIIVTGVLLVRRRVLWGVLVGIFFVQWSIFYPDQRYFLPILPLLMLAWWDTSLWLARRLPRPGLTLAASVLFLALMNFGRCLGFVLEQRGAPFLRYYLKGRYESLPEAAAQAKAQLPGNAVILCAEQFAEPMSYFSRLRTIAMYQDHFLSAVPQDRPLFVLLPGDDHLLDAMRAGGLRPGGAEITIPRRRSAEPLWIAPVTRVSPH
jgi:hypothetical protein